MSFLGQFAGKTAEKTGDSLRDWRRLILQEDEYQARKSQAEKQLALQRDQLSQTQRQFDWTKELQGMQLDLQRDQLTDNRVSTWYSNVSQGWDEMTPAQRLQVANTFESSEIATQGIGSDYQTLLRARIRDDMSPRNARQYLSGVLNTPWGQRVPQWAVTDALSALEGQEDYDSIKSDIEAFTGAENAEEAEEARQLARRGAFAGVEQTEAATQVDVAQAGYIGQQTRLAVQEHGINEEMRPLLVEHQELINEGLTTSNLMDGLRAGALPKQLRLGLQSMANEVQKGKLDNRILNATIDDVIRQIQAEADISEEQARHLVVTGSVRDALVNVEYETGKVNVDLIRANIDALNAQTEGQGLANMQTRTEVIDALISNGRADLLSEVGMDLLAPVFGEERAQDLVDSMTTDAFQQKDILDRRNMAGLLVAEAEADFMMESLDDRLITTAAQAAQEQYRADNMERFYQDEMNMREWELQLRERGVDVQEVANDIGWFRARTDRDLINSQIAINRARENEMENPVVAPSGNRNDVFNAIGDAGRGSVTRVSDRLADFGEAQAAVNRIQEYVSAAEQAEETGQAVNIPADLQEKYGMTPGDLAVAMQSEQIRADSLRNSAIREARAVYNAAIAQGVLAMPEDFGLDLENEQDAAFWSDVQRGLHGEGNVPNLMLENEDGTVSLRTPEGARDVKRADITAHIASNLDMYAPTLSGGALSGLDAANLWEVMTTGDDPEYTEAELRAAGFAGPEALNPAIEGAVNMYNDSRRGAISAMELATALPGRQDANYDLDDVNDLQEVSTVLEGRVSAFNNVLDEMIGAESLNDARLITYVASTLGMTEEELVDNGFADVSFRLLPTNEALLPAGKSNITLDFNALQSYASRELSQLDEALNGLSEYRSRY